MCKAALRHAMVVVTLLGVLVGAATAQSTASAKTDVTGEWAFEVQTQMGTGTPHVTFTQDGEKLTGHYSSTALGEAELAGTVKGDAIEFSLKAEVQGNAFTATYSGTVADSRTMKGKVTFGDLGEGTFTGKRR